MLRRDHIIPVTQSGCRAALMALGLVLVLQPPRLPQVSAQRPLNANVSGPMMLGPGTGGYGALATVRGYSLFNNGGAGHAGGAAAGNPSIGDHQSMGGGGTNRKLSSRPSYTNALDTAKRPQSGSIEADGGGHQLGGPGVGGAEGGGPYQPSNGRTASYRRPFASADLIVADGVLKASSNADGGGDASPGDTLLYPPVATGPGRKYTLYDVRQRQRPNDEATAVYAVEKNPMHVLKEIFRNDVSRTVGFPRSPYSYVYTKKNAILSATVIFTERAAEHPTAATAHFASNGDGAGGEMQFRDAVRVDLGRSGDRWLSDVERSESDEIESNRAVSGTGCGQPKRCEW